MDLKKILIFTLISPLLVSCATLPESPDPQLSIGTITTQVEPIGEMPATQNKGGVTINLTHVPFDTVSTIACSYEPNEGIIEFVPKNVSRETHTRLQEERFQILRVEPENLTLILTIRNQMDRVFRGEGAVVQYKVGQSIESIDKSHYLNLIEALIPPGSESQIRIQGPSVADLQEGSTISLQLFDIVTAIDEAGNVTKRDNFEWNFSVSRDSLRRTLTTVKSRQNIWVPNAQARALTQSSLDGQSLLPTRVIQPPEGTIIETKTVNKCYETSTY